MTFLVRESERQGGGNIEFRRVVQDDFGDLAGPGYAREKGKDGFLVHRLEVVVHNHVSS